jgi:PTS system mannose-specific IIA component
MIGLVLVTHGKLAEEFRHALEHVVGPQTALETVCIGPEDDMDQRRLDIVGAVSRVESGKGVIILTDMFGGTPSNLSISVMDSGRIEVIAGVNLPMLIKLAGIRGSNDIDTALAQAQDAGRKYRYQAGRLRPQGTRYRRNRNAGPDGAARGIWRASRSRARASPVRCT